MAHSWLLVAGCSLLVSDYQYLTSNEEQAIPEGIAFVTLPE
jgi:hypothetical protein